MMLSLPVAPKVQAKLYRLPRCITRLVEAAYDPEMTRTRMAMNASDVQATLTTGSSRVSWGPGETLDDYKDILRCEAMAFLHETLAVDAMTYGTPYHMQINYIRNEQTIHIVLSYHAYGSDEGDIPTAAGSTVVRHYMFSPFEPAKWWGESLYDPRR